jgi:phospholipase/lecithinase/hemolysin
MGLELEQDCVSCHISTIRATACNKEPHMPGMYPGEYVFMDIIHPVTRVGLTPDTTYAFYLLPITGRCILKVCMSVWTARQKH